MLPRTEKSISLSITRYLKKIPNSYYMTTTMGVYGKNGIADILFFYKSTCFAFEVKTEKAYASKHHGATNNQLIFKDHFNKSGCKSYIVCSTHQVKEILKNDCNRF